MPHDEKNPISTWFAEPPSTINKTDQNATMCNLKPVQNKHLNTICTPETEVVEYKKYSH